MKTNMSLQDSLLHDFYISHNAWLYAWLSRKIGSKFDAADLTHDTFLRILLKTDLVSITEPRAYLTKVATHLVIDHVRRRKLEQAYLEALALIHTSTYTHSPEDYQSAIETLLAISNMLDGLPTKVRSAFLMSRLQESTYDEIAQQLAVSASMVKQYIARAMVHCYQVIYGTPDTRK